MSEEVVGVDWGRVWMEEVLWGVWGMRRGGKGVKR